MRFSISVLLGLFLAVYCFSATRCWAQRSSEPEVEVKTLTTKDGVQLEITYYPSTAGKDAVPVVMLHDFKESRAVYKGLAQRLAEPGKNDKHDSFAVVTVDLRGHGKSVSQRSVSGEERQLEAAKLRKRDFEAMVIGDMEAVRKFLVNENDAGRLNLNRLAVIGTGLGASVGMNWAYIDWSMKPLATVKQGQDIKTMIMISPRWKQNGLLMQNAVKLPGLRSDVAALLMYGAKNRRVASDAKRIVGQLQRYHESPDSVEDGKLASLINLGNDTELQGTDWLKRGGKKAEDFMIRFLTQHTADPDFPHLIRRQN